MHLALQSTLRRNMCCSQKPHQKWLQVLDGVFLCVCLQLFHTVHVKYKEVMVFQRLAQYCTRLFLHFHNIPALPLTHLVFIGLAELNFQWIL